jgi:predicted O-methyltransferase YrrM
MLKNMGDKNLLDYIEFNAFIRDKCKSRDNDLIELEKYAYEKNVPIIKPETARYLEVMCSIKSPSKILEVGTAIGYSSIVMAKTCGDKTKIDSIEINKKNVIKARQNIKKLGYEDLITVLYGDALDVLHYLRNRYDMIFIDAAKGQYIEFLSLCLNLLKDDGIIITDNIFCQGLVPTTEKIVRRKRTMVRKVNEYIDVIMGEGFRTSLICIGDGVAVSRKK